MISAKRHALLICVDPGIRWHSPKGAAVHLRAVARGMLENGFRLSVLTRDGLAQGIETGLPRELSFDPVGRGSGRREYFKTGSPALREAGHLAQNPALWKAIRDLAAHDPVDLIYERFSLWSDLGARAADNCGMPLVVEVNSPLLREQERYRKLALRKVAAEMELVCLRRADRVIAVSGAVAREVGEKGVRGERIRVLPNIAEAATFYRGPYRAPEPGEPFVIGFSGSLKPWHGLEDFLPVFEALYRRRPQVRLQVLGAGPLRERLETWVSDRNLGDAVAFLGQLDHDRIPEQLAGWHLAVAPYPPLDDFYFSPLKIVEAQAAGLPVMASRLGEIPEMLAHGRSGILVSAGDPENWLKALLRAVDDPATLSVPAEAAREHTRSWSWREQVRRSVEDLSPTARQGEARAAG